MSKETDAKIDSVLKMMAGQTILVGGLAKLLIDRGALDKDGLVEMCNAILLDRESHGQSEAFDVSIKHFLSILE